MSIYGSELNPYKEYRKQLAFNANRERVHVSHNPSTIDQNQDLAVRLPNLGENDVMIPSSLKLYFNIELSSSDTGRYLVNNIAKAIIQNFKIEFEGRVVQNLEDFNVIGVYMDQYLTKKERASLIEQGIDDDNIINKLRIGVKANGDNQQKAVAAAYGNRFCIPLGKMFEMLKHLPFPGISDRPSFILGFAPYSHVIRDAGVTSGSTTKPADGTYKISNIALEFDKVNDKELKNLMVLRYNNIGLPYDRVLLNRIIPLKKQETKWNIEVNVASLSLKGLLLLFVDPENRKAYNVENEKFYNPKITKVDIDFEAEVRILYSHGLQAKDMYENALNYFGTKNSDVSLGEFFTTKYCLFIDLRSTVDNFLHGTGKRLRNTSTGFTLDIQKNADGDGPIKCYLYIFQDGQVNFYNGRVSSVGY